VKCELKSTEVYDRLFATKRECLSTHPVDNTPLKILMEKADVLFFLADLVKCVTNFIKKKL